MLKVKLLRPLDGKPEGSEAEYPEADAKELARRGIVELVEEKQAPAPANKAKTVPADKAAAPKKKGK